MCIHELYMEKLAYVKKDLILIGLVTGFLLLVAGSLFYMESTQSIVSGWAHDFYAVLLSR